MIWGLILNYLLNYVNVKFFIVNKYFDNFRVFFVVLYDIVEIMELLWNYNDDKSYFYFDS